MEMQYTIYNKYTGVITRIGRCEMALVGQCIHCMDVESVLEGIHNMRDHYIDIVTRRPKKKKEMVLQVNGDTISGVPNGSFAVIDELSHQVLDIRGDLTLSVEPGYYHVTLKHPQYFSKTVLMTVR